jgi:DNA-binding SARP family transcriptional activator
MFRVRLFGLGEARFFEHRLDGFPYQQAHLLLCYLLLNKHYPHSRERLAAVFWGDHPSQAARKYFRNSLWRLKVALQSLGMPVDGYLLASDESISFDSSSSYWLDVEAFETAINQHAHTPAGQLSPEAAHQLEAAAELYLGDLLEGVYEDWCLNERERLRLLHLNLLNKLLEYHASDGAYTRSLQYGERILVCDNTRESTHRQMIWLYWRSGDTNAALTQYHVCTQVLRSELGVQPADATRRLYEQVLHNQAAGWPGLAPLGRAPAPEGLQPLAESALQKINQLQKVIEETNAELRQIEGMIRRVLTESKRA